MRDDDNELVQLPTMTTAGHAQFIPTPLATILQERNGAPLMMQRHILHVACYLATLVHTYCLRISPVSIILQLASSYCDSVSTKYAALCAFKHESYAGTAVLVQGANVGSL